MTRPARIEWIDGSQEEAARIDEQLVREGHTFHLNDKTYPNCVLHPSDPQDGARTEHLTFICTHSKEDAGPTNNWIAPAEAKQRMTSLYNGSMKDRTMYVV